MLTSDFETVLPYGQFPDIPIHFDRRLQHAIRMLGHVDPDLRWEQSQSVLIFSHMLFVPPDVTFPSLDSAATWLEQQKAITVTELRCGISGAIIQCLKLEFLRNTTPELLQQLFIQLSVL